MTIDAQQTIIDSAGQAADKQVDLIEWYFEQGWTDGLPVVPPTPEKVAEVAAALGGEPEKVEARVPPRWGNLTREVLAINMVMAGCKPNYAPVVRAAMLAMCDSHFNLNGIQTTTHMAAPLLVVNGPIRHEIGMNAGSNVFGSGNRGHYRAGYSFNSVECRRRLARRPRQKRPGPPRQVHLLHRRK